MTAPLFYGTTPTRATLKVSLIVPCFNAQEHLHRVVEGFSRELDSAFADAYEIILIDDGSSDETYQVIGALAAESSRIFGVQLSRNFGQGAATLVGFRQSRGEILVYADDDGEAPIEEVCRLVDAVRGGADIAVATYASRNKPVLRRAGTRFNNLLVSRSNRNSARVTFSNFWAVHSAIAAEMCQFVGLSPFLDDLLIQSSQHIALLPMKAGVSEARRSRYTLGRLIRLQLTGALTMSVRPLRLMAIMGLVTTCAAAAFLLYLLLSRLMGAGPPAGYSSLVGLLIGFMGIVLSSLGVLGEYLGRVFQAVMGFSQAIVRDSTTGGRAIR